jgi:predicted HTH transcriptional regulator
LSEIGTPYRIDLKTLSLRESEQIEWKENVADPDDVAETLSAFANDWANLGGGYVVCGAKEERDEHGFPRVVMTGLTANRLKEVEGRVLAACRDRVSPSIAPLVEELPADNPDRRVLVFIMASTRFAHLFRRGDGTGKHYVRISRETREARNGILRELLVRRGVLEEWDRRVSNGATISDIDLIALRDALQRMGVFNPDRGLDDYLSETRSLSPFVPPLCVREPLTGILRPRNFTMLLFGRNTQQYVPGAFALFSVYPGLDRSEPHAERHEISGTLVDQARRLIELLDIQSYVAFDKTSSTPNAVKYPRQALHEAMINGLAHRDYEIADPARITVFSERIEILSPGSLPTGVSLENMRQGRAPAKWRNQTLAWFLNRLQLAQAEGQGIPTILRSMREEGCPPPQFEANETQVVCILPAHPRHALAREHRSIEEAISLGAFEKAQKAILALLNQDPMNFRSIQLFAEVQRALSDPTPVKEFIRKHKGHLGSLPPMVVTQLADVLLLAHPLSSEDRDLARQLYVDASKGRIAEREVRQVAIGLSMSGDESAALGFIDQQFQEHPNLAQNPWLLQVRGNALIGLAKQCTQTAKNRSLSSATRGRAWEDCRRFLQKAERDLRRAASLTSEIPLSERIQKSLSFLEELKRIATPPNRRGRTRGGQRK